MKVYFQERPLLHPKFLQRNLLHRLADILYLKYLWEVHCVWKSFKRSNISRKSSICRKSVRKSCTYSPIYIQYAEDLQKVSYLKEVFRRLPLSRRLFEDSFISGSPVIKKFYWLLLKIESHLSASTYKTFSKGLLEVNGGPS